MTQSSFDPADLGAIGKKIMMHYNGNEEYFPYKPGPDGVPPFLPLAQNRHQIRLTASTHDMKGILRNYSVESVNNTKRLKNKIVDNLDSYTLYEADEVEGAETMIISWDISAQAAREAAARLKSEGKLVSLLIAKTLLPVPGVYLNILKKYKRIIVAEENLDGQLRQILFGKAGRNGLSGVNSIGSMINPESIMSEVKND
jgi:2-oxoglutarate/2-oxoacid ferredoxin oxidoreductase subunit alpha